MFRISTNITSSSYIVDRIRHIVGGCGGLYNRILSLPNNRVLKYPLTKPDPSRSTKKRPESTRVSTLLQRNTWTLVDRKLPKWIKRPRTDRIPSLPRYIESNKSSDRTEKGDHRGLKVYVVLSSSRSQVYGKFTDLRRINGNKVTGFVRCTTSGFCHNLPWFVPVSLSVNNVGKNVC